MTLVILEGPDGGGKTRLAPRLNPIKIISHGPYLGERRIFPHYVESLRIAARYPDELVVFDRSWLSEPIYGSVMRGEDRLGTEARMLDRVALGLGAVVILCVPPLEKVVQSFLDRRQDEYPQEREQITMIWKAYGSVACGAFTGLPVVLYDYTQGSPDALSSVLTRSAIDYTWPGIGAYGKASTLFVGDRRGSTNELGIPYEWPFVSDRGCSPWLADQLDRIGVPERELHWVNARDIAGDPTDLEFARGKFRNVIALGANADKALDRAKILHRAIDHPQYWKRFHHREVWKDLANCFTSKGKVLP